MGTNAQTLEQKTNKQEYKRKSELKHKHKHKQENSNKYTNKGNKSKPSEAYRLALCPGNKE